MRTRLLAVLLAACTAALPAHAGAPKPQITDKTGDEKVPNAPGMDIVSATFSTAGTTARVGKRTVYTPTTLVVTVAYAGPVAADPYVTHTVLFTVPGCGEAYLEVFGGGTYGVADCLSDEFAFTTAVSGATLTYRLPFASIGKQYLKAGAALTDLVVYSALGDPVEGFETEELSSIATGGLVEGAVDLASTTAAYKVA